MTPVGFFYLGFKMTKTDEILIDASVISIIEATIVKHTKQITYDEINHILPDITKDENQIDYLIDLLEENNIELVDKRA